MGHPSWYWECPAEPFMLQRPYAGLKGSPKFGGHVVEGLGVKVKVQGPVSEQD